MRVGFLFLLIFLLFPIKTYAIYDSVSVPNNRFGIHILELSELSKAAELVNSSGGDWGYVTIPIRANDRDLPKWTRFMEEAGRLHLIPILRIASFVVDPPAGEAGHWMAPNEYDLVDFANFLDELPWPIKNRYVVIYNEPNHKNEWGGFVTASEYSRVLERALDIFHKKNADFFVISAGLDASAANTSDSLNEYEYMRQMEEAVPGIFSKIDGFSSHAYGNPGFRTAPNIYSLVNTANYRFEENYLCRSSGACDLKIFITEAGWQEPQTWFYKFAFSSVWVESNIVAVTPFVLDAREGPFVAFSFVDASGNFKDFAREIMSMPKTAAKPEITLKKAGETDKMETPWNGKKLPTSKPNLIEYYLREFFRMLRRLL